MSKKAFENVMAGLRDALAYAQGDETAVTRVVRVETQPADIKATRRKIGLGREPEAALRAIRR